MTTGVPVPSFIAVLLVLGAAVAALDLVRRFAGSAMAWRSAPAIGLVAIFVSITHLPLPDPLGSGCGSPRTRPLLTPLRFVTGALRRWDADRTALEWLTDLTISSTALNLHACVVIGAALALCLRRWTTAVCLGIAMTGLIELSQLTAVFGLFECPWRQFEVDDLILNAAGVALGFVIARSAGLHPKIGTFR